MMQPSYLFKVVLPMYSSHFYINLVQLIGPLQAEVRIMAWILSIASWWKIAKHYINKGWGTTYWSLKTPRNNRWIAPKNYRNRSLWF